MPPTDLLWCSPGSWAAPCAKTAIWYGHHRPSALRAIATFGASVKRLKLPDGIGDDHPGDGVEPDSLMPDLHICPGIWTAVKGYDTLTGRLRSLDYREPRPDPDAPPGNLLLVPYDWRLSCRYNGQRLARLIEPAWSDGGHKAARTPTLRWCSSAIPWAG